MKADLTIIEIIGFAIRSEEDAATFYGHVAMKIKNKLARAKYEDLAREEGRHRKMLAELYCKMTNEEYPPSKIPGEPETAEGKASPKSEDLEQLLKIAISREHEASKFYSDAEKKATDHNAQRILSYLAGIEHGHELTLKIELSTYLHDRDFYINNPEIQLLG